MVFWIEQQTGRGCADQLFGRADARCNHRHRGPQRLAEHHAIAFERRGQHQRVGQRELFGDAVGRQRTQKAHARGKLGHRDRRAQLGRIVGLELGAHQHQLGVCGWQAAEGLNQLEDALAPQQIAHEQQAQAQTARLLTTGRRARHPICSRLCDAHAARQAFGMQAIRRQVAGRNARVGGVDGGFFERQERALLGSERMFPAG